MIWKTKIHHPLLMKALKKLTNKQILLCMDGDVRYVEECILLMYLCALIEVIII